MRNTFHIAQLHDLVRQQPQRPLRSPLRRLAATQRNKMRLEIAICFTFVDPLPFMAIKRNVETLLNKSSFNPLNLHGAHFQDIGDFQLS